MDQRCTTEEESGDSPSDKNKEETDDLNDDKEDTVVGKSESLSTVWLSHQADIDSKSGIEYAAN